MLASNSNTSICHYQRKWNEERLIMTFNKFINFRMGSLSKLMFSCEGSCSQCLQYYQEISWRSHDEEACFAESQGSLHESNQCPGECFIIPFFCSVCVSLVVSSFLVLFRCLFPLPLLTLSPLFLSSPPMLSSPFLSSLLLSTSLLSNLPSLPNSVCVHSALRYVPLQYITVTIACLRLTDHL